MFKVRMSWFFFQKTIVNKATYSVGRDVHWQDKSVKLAYFYFGEL